MANREHLIALDKAKTERAYVLRCYRGLIAAKLHEPVTMRDVTELYQAGRLPNVFPVPAIRIPCGKIHALSMGCWRWYWYLSGFNYR